MNTSTSVTWFFRLTKTGFDMIAAYDALTHDRQARHGPTARIVRSSR